MTPTTKKRIQRAYLAALKERREIEELKKPKRVVSEAFKKRVDEINRIAKKPEHQKAMLDYFRATGQIKDYNNNTKLGTLKTKMNESTKKKIKKQLVEALREQKNLDELEQTIKPKRVITEEHKKRTEEINRISKKPEHQKAMLEYFRATGQIKEGVDRSTTKPIDMPVSERFKKEVEQANRSARKPENQKAMLDYFRKTGQIKD
jgi:hypothetical protein